MLTKKFVRLQPIEYIGGSKKEWKCACECGNTRIVSENSLIKGYAKSCGCLQRRKEIILLPNQKFGKLCIIGRTYSKRLVPAWKCLCDCGNIIILETSSLIKGNNISCGCGRQRHPDLSGKTIKFWTLLKKLPNKKYSRYLCQCICGNTKEMYLDVILNPGLIGHCGCVDKARRTKDQEERNRLRRNRTKIMIRDSYTCQLCGIKHLTHRLKSHHIFPFKEYESLRLDPNNLITLCSKCHIKVHGKGFNQINIELQKILLEIITWITTDVGYKTIIFTS